jgi:pimeloyl-ACP methyl ester carboxylesterase
MGGIVIGEVAERVPEKIAGLVFVAATLIVGDDPPAAQQGLAQHHRILPTADSHSVAYDPAAAAAMFYNRTDPAVAAQAVARIGTQPVATMTGARTATMERFAACPRAYVECTDDRSVPIGHQRAMQAALPCDPVFTLDTDHSPFYSAPAALAEALVAAAARFAASDAEGR